jgi:hypothetical protein
MLDAEIKMRKEKLLRAELIPLRVQARNTYHLAEEILSGRAPAGNSAGSTDAEAAVLFRRAAKLFEAIDRRGGQAGTVECGGALVPTHQEAMQRAEALEGGVAGTSKTA